jgi:hypothetical protein
MDLIRVQPISASRGNDIWMIHDGRHAGCRDQTPHVLPEFEVRAEPHPIIRRTSNSAQRIASRAGRHNVTDLAAARQLL